MRHSDILKFVKHSSEAAAAKARINQIEEILKQNKRESTLGLAKAYTDELTADLTGLKSKALQAYKESNLKAYTLDIQLQAEGMAKAAGSINPELTAQVIAQQLNVMEDASGELFHLVRDISSNVAMSIESALERLSRNQDYSVLFHEPVQSPRNQKANIPSAGSNEVNPWRKEQFNLTMQGNILLSDPAKAERLKRESGL
jgi:hypothetical protein